MVLLHEDDVHYNIIVHKSHNAYKSKGDNPEISKSWAQVTKAYRPGVESPSGTNTPPGDRVTGGTGQQGQESVKNMPHQKQDEFNSEVVHNTESASDWKKVGKRGNLNKHYNNPVNNRFEILPKDDEIMKYVMPKFPQKLW